MVNMLASGRLP